MQASSPLAAMQPPSLAGPWGRHDNHGIETVFMGSCSYNSPDFNFTSMARHRAIPDYFSCKPVRGSSPAASLAVDLSQNFHIDRSPALPTPRRSLFTSNMLLAYPRETVITPPIPSSSPGPLPDAMDISPLPHKPPHAVQTQMSLCLPTPEATPVLEERSSSPPEEPRLAPFVNRSQSQPTQPVVLRSPPAERKLANPLRPNLRRGASTANLISKSNTQSRLQKPFKFGFGSAFASKPSLETFAESPPSAERKLPPSNSSSNLFSPCPFQSGSPMASGRRPSMSKAAPPRIGLGRRTQSVQYSNPHKAMRSEKRHCTTGSFQCSASLEETYKPKLPHFVPENDLDSLPRMNKETLIDVLDGSFADQTTSAMIIDCRFEYEFEGGHIDGATNFNDKEELSKRLFDDPASYGKTLIFHCEYSAHRAPIMAKFIRQRDRTLNQDNYPLLTYPEVYILEGGYSTFFKAYSARCYPQNYVEMDAKEHENACERGMAKVKRRAKLSRAQTYAFGQSAVPPLSRDDGRPAVPTLPTLATFNCTSAPLSMFDAMDIDMVESPSDIRRAAPRRLESF